MSSMGGWKQLPWGSGGRGVSAVEGKMRRKEIGSPALENFLVLGHPFIDFALGLVL